MRGDFEILGYNLIQWAGGDLPWEKNNLLNTPVKVQQSKEDLMSNLDSRLKECFSNQPNPGMSIASLKEMEKQNNYIFSIAQLQSIHILNT